jgi:uncharacterized protein YjbI with pentapeptide repeats
MKRHRDRNLRRDRVPDGEQQVPELLKNIADCSINAGRAFMVYISVCIYGAITICGISDRQLVLMQDTTLPLIGVKVPHTGFVVLFPVIVIVLFIHLQIFHLQLNRNIAALGKINPAYPQSRLYPWFLNVSLPSNGLSGKIQQVLIRFVLWMSLPVVLLLNVIWIIRLHEAWLSHSLIAVSLLGYAVNLIFWWEHSYKRHNVKLTFAKFKKRWWVFVLWGAAFAIHVCLLFYISSKEFKYSWKYEIWPSWSNPSHKVERQVPRCLLLDLNNTCLVQEPSHDYSCLYWVDYHKRHFEGANLSGSVLKRANLAGAQLCDADLSRSILDLADLRGAGFERANLQGAMLKGADLCGAVLFEADLSNSILDSANLRGTNLSKANLAGASLKGADLEYSTLQSIPGDTSLAGLCPLCAARSLWGAHMDTAVLCSVRAYCDGLLNVR